MKMKIQRVEIFANTEPSKDNAANYAVIHIYEGGKNQAFLFSNDSVVAAVTYLSAYAIDNKTENVFRFADRRNAVSCVNDFIEGTRE